ncbi:unnamed protein product [Owenia fusiformis]|uniref:G-protein coupled receptors family 1 profile domain-containing protein n=1 Tax=Owenia fusiformis TaxID=6347 RepID=A0A8S4PTM4_OWEFU|nr:unnamed protein product [Owenia fusiformis]
MDAPPVNSSHTKTWPPWNSSDLLTIAPNVSNTSSLFMDNVCDQSFWETRLQVEFYVRGVIIPIICFVGLIGSFLNLIILTRPNMVNPINMFLLGLDIADIGVLFILGIYYTYFYSSQKWILIESNSTEWLTTVPLWPWRVFWAVAVIPANFFATVSNTHALGVSVFRYIAVRFPVKAHNCCSNNSAKKIIIAIYIWGLLLNSPDFFQKSMMEGSIGNFTFNYMGYSKLFHNRVFNMIYYPVRVIFNILIPWFACLLLSILLITTLRRRMAATDRRRSVAALVKNTLRSKRKDKITVTLLAVNLSFLICQFPAAVWGMLTWLVENRDMFYCHSFQIARAFIDLLGVLNFATNFFLYAITHKDFRQTFSRVFGLQKLKTGLFASRKNNKALYSEIRTNNTTRQTNV